MNHPLDNLIKLYAEIELGVQELMRDRSGPVCAQCTCVCCRADICEEAIESPFLKKVHKQADLFSDQYGFLTQTGCGLETGRPPVCHEYFCNDQFYYQPDDQHADVLKVLGALVSHAGRNADGEIHLVEIMQEEKLGTLDFRALESQFKESFDALEVIRSFYAEGNLSEDDRRTLDKIHLPEF